MLNVVSTALYLLYAMTCSNISTHIQLTMDLSLLRANVAGAALLLLFHGFCYSEQGLSLKQSFHIEQFQTTHFSSMHLKLRQFRTTMPPCPTTPLSCYLKEDPLLVTTRTYSTLPTFSTTSRTHLPPLPPSPSALMTVLSTCAPTSSAAAPPSPLALTTVPHPRQRHLLGYTLGLARNM